jgi:hypothetical protein
MALPEEIPARKADTEQLIRDFGLGQDAEYFADPSRRLEFVETQSADDFFEVIRHANARLRGYEPREGIPLAADGKRAETPMLGAPEASEKPAAFQAGFEAIQSYLHTTSDSLEQKVQGAGMAVEALIIWVHPFDEGNGRTARFFGKFIEDGSVDTQQLIGETVDRDVRLKAYNDEIRVDRYNTLKFEDDFISEEVHQELLKTKMPINEGISQSIARLLEDKDMQAHINGAKARSENTVAKWQAIIDRRNQNAA